MVELGGELVGERGIFAVAAAFHDADETVAEVGLDQRGELDRDNRVAEGIFEQRPETFTDAGGIDHDLDGFQRATSARSAPKTSTCFWPSHSLRKRTR